MTRRALFKVHNLPHSLPTRVLKAIIEHAVPGEVVWLCDAFHMDGNNGYNVIVLVINPSCSDKDCSSMMRNALKRELADYPATRKGIEVSSKVKYASDPKRDAKRSASFVVMIHAVDTGNNFTARLRSETADFIEEHCGVRVAKWDTLTRRCGRKPFCVNIAYLAFVSPREADRFLSSNVFDATPVPNRPELLLHCVQKIAKPRMYATRRAHAPSESSDTQSIVSHESSADSSQEPVALNSPAGDEEPPCQPQPQRVWWRHDPYNLTETMPFPAGGTMLF